MHVVYCVIVAVSHFYLRRLSALVCIDGSWEGAPSIFLIAHNTSPPQKLRDLLELIRPTAMNTLHSMTFRGAWSSRSTTECCRSYSRIRARSHKRVGPLGCFVAPCRGRFHNNEDAFVRDNRKPSGLRSIPHLKITMPKMPRYCSVLFSSGSSKQTTNILPSSAPRGISTPFRTKSNAHDCYKCVVRVLETYGTGQPHPRQCVTDTTEN